MIYWVANILILLSTGLDVYAVSRQNAKTSKCKDSSSVSTDFFFYKVMKDVIGSAALILYQNWAGLALIVPGFIYYIITYINVIKYKPRSWEPKGIERLLK